MLETLLFNSSARMYNLRILLLITFALIPTTLISLPEADADALLVFYNHYIMAIDIASSCLILPHYILRLFASKLNAILDLFLTVVEICMVAYVTGFSIKNDLWGSGSTLFTFTLVARPIQLTALLISGIWSAVTIMNSPQKLIQQHFEFLGGCPQPGGRYTPSRILINRSVSKPLVRGEFSGIVLVRGMVISILILGLALLGVYIIIVVPLNAQTFTRPVLTNFVPLSESVNIGSNLGVILCGQFAGIMAEQDGRSYLDIKINGTDCPALNFLNGTEACGSKLAANSEDGFHSLFWSCTVPWQDVRTIDMTIRSNFLVRETIPVVYVQLGQGDFNDIARYTEPIALMPNAHLFATLTWTQQQVMNSVLGALATPKNVLTAELNALQADTRFLPNTTWDPTNSTLPDSTLSIFQTRMDSVKSIQQYTETSAVAGLARIGGFWTFVNGAFAMIFGANVVYFLFGRRPLSALGVVHIFQRKALIRQWRQDFPALHSEGGRPGSESAGIVAFLRERLVDLDDDYIHQGDLEAQKSSASEHTTLIRSLHGDTCDNDTIEDTARVRNDDTCSTANTTRMDRYTPHKTSEKSTGER